jgi:hypothetical protein
VVTLAQDPKRLKDISERVNLSAELRKSIPAKLTRSLESQLVLMLSAKNAH